MISVFKKEFSGYFFSSFGFVFIGIFLLISGITFSTYNLIGMRGDMNGMFGIFSNISIMTFPILTMKLFSEERRLGTEQLLLTSKLKCWQIVVGKYLAALSLFLIALMGTIIYVGIIKTYGNPNLGSIVGSYTGFILLGSAFIAMSMFASSIFENQITSAIGSFGILFISVIIGSLGKSLQIPILKDVLSFLSVTTKYESITRGILTLEPIVYYIFFSIFFVFLTTKTLEKRKLD